MILEVCVDSPSGLLAAVAGGADRIELCSSLALGGLTPSPGLIALAASCPRPSRAMIRPRMGGFLYNKDEIEVMRRDIDAVRAAGLAGVVIGANDRSGRLDEMLLAALVAHAQGLEIALHRAIDLAPDPLAGLELAVELGIHTILTSGGAPTALAGTDRIRSMVDRAGDLIEILAGGGVSADNVGQLVSTTGVRAVHSSCSAPYHDPDPRAVAFGFVMPGAKDTDQQMVARMKSAVMASAR